MKLIRKMLELIDEHIPSQVLTFLSLVSSVLTICSMVLGVLVDVCGWTLLAGIAFLYNRPYLMLIACIVTIFLLLCTTFHYYLDGRSRLELFANEYHVATHQFRDLENQLNYDYINYTLDTNSIVSLVQKYCQTVTDSVCLQLEQITKHKISGCIKLVNPEGSSEDGTPCTIGNWTVSDFVRSGSTEEKRKKIDPERRSLIKENTDYMEIMDPNNTRIQFYQPDLLAYEKRLRLDDHEYMNSTYGWKEKYRCTAVVPIQIDSGLLPKGMKGVYNVIGFLCVDSMETNALPMKQKKPIMNMLKAYSDLLYCVLDTYSKYLEMVMEAKYDREYIIHNHPQGINGNILDVQTIGASNI